MIDSDIGELAPCDRQVVPVSKPLGSNNSDQASELSEPELELNSGQLERKRKEEVRGETNCWGRRREKQNDRELDSRNLESKKDLTLERSVSVEKSRVEDVKSEVEVQVEVGWSKTEPVPEISGKSHAVVSSSWDKENKRKKKTKKAKKKKPERKKNNPTCEKEEKEREKIEVNEENSLRDLEAEEANEQLGLDLHRSSSSAVKLASLVGSSCCRCTWCAANHWPARLKIVGPITMRRRCQRRPVEELKVVGRPYPLGTSSSSSSSSQQTASSAQLENVVAPTATKGTTNNQPDRWLGGSRCKANSISCCSSPSSSSSPAIGLILPAHQQQSSAVLRLAAYSGSQSRCLLCELSSRPLRPSRAAVDLTEKANSQATSRRDYLKPTDCLAISLAGRPRRRHSWICR